MTGEVKGAKNAAKTLKFECRVSARDAKLGRKGTQSLRESKDVGGVSMKGGRHFKIL